MSMLFKGVARLERRVAELVQETASLRERVADLEGGRSTGERLAGEVRGLGQRLDAELDKFSSLARQVVALDRKVDQGEEHMEAQRRKLVALAKSVDWETDSLRKSLEPLLIKGKSPLQRAKQADPAYPLTPTTEA